MAPRIIEPEPNEWREYRALRLEALQSDPDAFSATYDEAVLRPDEFWIQRLGGDDTLTFVAIVEDQMVGMVGAYLAAHDDPNCAVVIGLYVSTAYRGLGLGRRLMDALLKRLAQLPTVTMIRLGVSPKQTAALGLYQALGFEIVPQPEDGDAMQDTLRMERAA